MRTWAGALCAITLFTTAATSASASEYMVDEAGKFGPKGAMVMSRQSLRQGRGGGCKRHRRGNA